MTIKDTIEEYMLECKARKFTIKTLRGMKWSFNDFLRGCEREKITELSEITPAFMRRYSLWHIEQGHRGTYINGLLKAVKGLMEFCNNEEIYTFNTKRCIKWVKEEQPIITAFQPSDVRKIMDEFRGKNDFINSRNYCIFAFFFETGMRCGELINLLPEHIEEDAVLIVDAKGHKNRVVPITTEMRYAMRRYNRFNEEYFENKRRDDNYFVSFRGRELTVPALEALMRQKFPKDLTPGVRVSPHTCRHTYAQQLLRNGVDVYTISRLLGHSNIKITETYLRGLSDDSVLETGRNNSVLRNLKDKDKR